MNKILKRQNKTKCCKRVRNKEKIESQGERGEVEGPPAQSTNSHNALWGGAAGEQSNWTIGTMASGVGDRTLPILPERRQALAIPAAK